MRKVEVVPYNLGWVTQFNVEADSLRNILGAEIVAIHHIGSTSVPMLAAKPIIDIMPVVSCIERIDTYNDIMIQNGYEPKGENGIEGRRYFTKGGFNRTHHIHLYSLENPQVCRHLAFRDFLRVNHDVAKEYGELKSQLAAKYPFDMGAYIEGKKQLGQSIDKMAAEWYRAERGRSN